MDVRCLQRVLGDAEYHALIGRVFLGEALIEIRTEVLSGIEHILGTVADDLRSEELPVSCKERIANEPARLT